MNGVGRGRNCIRLHNAVALPREACFGVPFWPARGRRSIGGSGLFALKRGQTRIKRTACRLALVGLDWPANLSVSSRGNEQDNKLDPAQRRTYAPPIMLTWPPIALCILCIVYFQSAPLRAAAAVFSFSVCLPLAAHYRGDIQMHFGAGNEPARNKPVRESGLARELIGSAAPDYLAAHASGAKFEPSPTFTGPGNKGEPYQ